jgi:hypothetical protein
LEYKLNRTLSFTKITAFLEFTNNKLYICLDFTNSAYEKKRKDYYINLVKTSIIKEITQEFQELIISAKKDRSTLWKEKFNLQNKANNVINKAKEEDKLIDDILSEGFAFQKRKTVKPVGKAAKHLAEELLDLLDNDTNKAEVILRSLVNFNVDHSIEWYLEKAIEKVLKEKNPYFSNKKHNFPVEVK